MSKDGSCSDCGQVDGAEGAAAGFDFDPRAIVRGEVELDGPILVPSDGSEAGVPPEWTAPSARVGPAPTPWEVAPGSQWLTGALHGSSGSDLVGLGSRRSKPRPFSLMTLDGRVASNDEGAGGVAFQEGGGDLPGPEMPEDFDGGVVQPDVDCAWDQVEKIGKTYELPPVKGMEQHVLFLPLGVLGPIPAVWRGQKLRERRQALTREKVRELMSVRNALQSSAARSIARRMNEQIGLALDEKCHDPCTLGGPYLEGPQYGPLNVFPSFRNRLIGPLRVRGGLGTIYILEIHYEFKATGSWSASVRFVCI